MKKKLTVYVAAHKKVQRYINDCYQLIHVGAANSDQDFGYIRDDKEENISTKNPYWCELTGLYWVWKNVSEETHIGVCHYRRYPSKRKYTLNPCASILIEKEILRMLENYDILLPYKSQKGSLNWRCKTKEELEQNREYTYIRRAILKYSPEYITELDSCFMAKKMSFGNIDMEQDLILHDDLKPRELGYLSEWMLNVWVEHNKLKVKYIPTVFMEEKRNIKFLVKMILERLGRK